MTNIIRVVAAVVDTQQATFYKVDGTTVVIKQGDSRLADIIRQVTPVCARGGIAEVDLDFYPQDSADVFSAFEQRSSGVVKFFRIAKNKLSSFFGSKEEAKVQPMSVGLVDNSVKNVPFVPESGPEITQMASAIEEIMAHAKPVSEGINRSALESADEDIAETIVAVMGNTVVPDVHKLESQFKRSNQEEHTLGMQRFMARVAAVANKRSHSVQDLMRFMQRGDLPVAEDGSIVIYKILRKRKLDQHPGFDYVDCHSNRVPQRVGSYVHMEEDMVDMNRRNECSNGLHVARRAYLHGFSGDVVTICKVAPEDVIAVPDYDSNKMRVCGYHILSELPHADYVLLQANLPINSETGLKLLAAALAGHHPVPSNSVKITGSYGGGIVVTEHVVNKAPVATFVAMEAAPVAPAAPAVAATILDTEVVVHEVEKVDVRAMSAEVTDVVAGGKTRAELAYEMLTAWETATGADKIAKAKELKAFRRSKKISWERLDIPVLTGIKIDADASL